MKDETMTNVGTVPRRGGRGIHFAMSVDVKRVPAMDRRQKRNDRYQSQGQESMKNVL
jgi:hypothetical protein